MQVLSTRESRMQILTYNWVSNFVEKNLKNHNLELYVSITKYLIDFNIKTKVLLPQT
jgi:hypothetical protein